jgi:hypothetical protein
MEKKVYTWEYTVKTNEISNAVYADRIILSKEIPALTARRGRFAVERRYHHTVINHPNVEGVVLSYYHTVLHYNNGVLKYVSANEVDYNTIFMTPISVERRPVGVLWIPETRFNMTVMLDILLRRFGLIDNGDENHAEIPLNSFDESKNNLFICSSYIYVDKYHEKQDELVKNVYQSYILELPLLKILYVEDYLNKMTYMGDAPLIWKNVSRESFKRDRPLISFLKEEGSIEYPLGSGVFYSSPNKNYSVILKRRIYPGPYEFIPVLRKTIEQAIAPLPRELRARFRSVTRVSKRSDVHVIISSNGDLIKTWGVSGSHKDWTIEFQGIIYQNCSGQTLEIPAIPADAKIQLVERSQRIGFILDNEIIVMSTGPLIGELPILDRIAFAAACNDYAAHKRLIECVNCTYPQAPYIIDVNSEEKFHVNKIPSGMYITPSLRAHQMFYFTIQLGVTDTYVISF